jgi:hypothetical protein
MGKITEQSFFKGGEHVKKCSTSLAIKEMHKLKKKPNKIPPHSCENGYHQEHK